MAPKRYSVYRRTRNYVSVPRPHLTFRPYSIVYNSTTPEGVVNGIHQVGAALLQNNSTDDFVVTHSYLAINFAGNDVGSSGTNFVAMFRLAPGQTNPLLNYTNNFQNMIQTPYNLLQIQQYTGGRLEVDIVHHVRIPYRFILKPQEVLFCIVASQFVSQPFRSTFNAYIGQR